MKDLNLLVVDDDDLVIQSVKMALPSQWRMVGVQSPNDVPGQSFQAAFVDMHLTGNQERAEGVDLIKKLHKEDPHLEIVAMSGDLDRDLMERCLKAGASRFLAKPLSVDELVLTLEKIEAWLLLQGATQRGQRSDQRWIGSSAKSQEIQKKIASLKGEQGPILLEGESGTGKEVASQLIHSQEAGTPFIAINIASIPESLFESEFFGHVKGAFTGADQNKMGLAEAAHGGDLFLDEVEALSLPLQVKLLRFLETGEIRRVGGKDTIHVQTRVIAATNRNLDKLVEEDKFREDLLWRLSGKKILLPPLRERLDDVKELCQHFFSQDKARKKDLSEDALEAMKQYSWPGNVRELKRVCEQLMFMAPLPLIRKEDVMPIIRPKAEPIQMTEIKFEDGLPQILGQYEKTVITQCLEKYNDVDEVARVLKISRSSLYKKIKDHDVNWRSQ